MGLTSKAVSNAVVAHHILVSGKVQGVFYRKYTQKGAVARSLTGWVRNLPDGRVEILAEGPVASVKSLEQWCHTGSPHSKVTEVLVEDVTKRPPARKKSGGGAEEGTAEPRKVPVVTTPEFSSFDVLR